jgi:hypothetical protein
MTTLTIEIPDKSKDTLIELVELLGGKVVSVNADDKDLTPAGLDLIKRGLKEALLIKEGKVKATPISDL